MWFSVHDRHGVLIIVVVVMVLPLVLVSMVVEVTHVMSRVVMHIKV